MEGGRKHPKIPRSSTILKSDPSSNDWYLFANGKGRNVVSWLKDETGRPSRDYIRELRSN